MISLPQEFPSLQPNDLDVLAGSFDKLQLSQATAYTALDGTVHALTRLTFLATKLHLEDYLSLTDLFNCPKLT